MNRKVLNRPMFARMRDGSIKPVQYAQVGLLVQGGKALVPYVPRGLAAIKNTLPAIISGGRNLITKGKNLIKGGGGGPGTAVGPYLGGGSTLTKSKIPFWKMLGYGTAPIAISSLTDYSEQIDETETQKNDKISGAPGGYPDKKKKKKKNGELDILDKEIKKGTLDDLITERIGIFEKHLGDGRDTVKTGGFAALTEFGLNLASARGGNFMDKIARSAKDPLKTFTAIGMAAKDRADKIKMAGVKAGIEAEQAALDRAAEADPEGTTFQRNLGTLRTMFTDKDGQLTIAEEDLVNMAKSGATTSRKEFAAQIYASLGGTQNPSTLKQYTDADIVGIINKGWAVISGEQPVVEEVEEKKEVISLD
jgi:hypothetical protein|tara:strand:- start:4204 stop:5295 length:1092 start_codon:yes stop_codon:yes gene_type:complete